MAVTSLASHKMRSFLTTLGIIIGVATVIAMMAIVNGVNGIVEGELSRIGANVFYVMKFPAVRISFDWRKYHKRPNLNLDDARAIKERIPTIRVVSPELWTPGNQVRTGEKSTDPNVTAIGAEEGFLEINGLNLEEGRFFLPQEVAARRKLCLLGVDVVERLFPYISPIGRDIRIGPDQYEVIGVIEKRGVIFGESQDNIVVLPLGNLIAKFKEREDMSIGVQTQPGASVSKAIDAVRNLMRIRHKLTPSDEDDFELETRDTIMSAYQNMTGSIFAAAIGIAAISLIVGGIGIMNIMLVSVKERTREIGIRMSIGARRKDIRNQFLVEAVALSISGGILGVFLAIGGLYAAVKFYPTLPMQINLSHIALAVIFSMLVGIFFGVWPARRAAALDPIECLRYE